MNRSVSAKFLRTIKRFNSSAPKTASPDLLQKYNVMTNEKLVLHDGQILRSQALQVVRDKKRLVDQLEEAKNEKNQELVEELELVITYLVHLERKRIIPIMRGNVWQGKKNGKVVSTAIWTTVVGLLLTYFVVFGVPYEAMGSLKKK